ncbi:hypothetical protein HaLaN_02504 [Haematococcus lacustris]|uniref:Uncharacterized protein n=1 Tax=Haematococcus lacustris TaxID=44745 RepID=A0A699YE41_HAELA|nr:hypothetical protein HaLaN_02504 [Haematococcus lacustris]
MAGQHNQLDWARQHREKRRYVGYWTGPPAAPQAAAPLALSPSPPPLPAPQPCMVYPIPHCPLGTHTMPAPLPLPEGPESYAHHLLPSYA